MFKEKDYVVHKKFGVCRIQDIGTLSESGLPRNKIYYTLIPEYIKGSKVYFPIDAPEEKVPFREVSSKEYILDIVEHINDIETVWINDDKKREQIYKNALNSHDCVEWIKIIKALYIRKQQRVADGKKATAIDDRYLHMAEEQLYGEMAIALEMNKDDMRDFITQRVEEEN